MSTIATILIPTFNHGSIIKYPLLSILSQTVQDFEIFVVGDGVPINIKEQVRKICKIDQRISFFDFPKDQRRGEVYRHQVLSKRAKGKYIFYLSDDDLWFPNHLETLIEAFQKFNFVHSLHVNIFPVDTINIQPTDLALPEHRQWIIEKPAFGFDLSFGAHTRKLYQQLSYGWRTTPPDVNTDVYMWRQFLINKKCKPLSIQKPTGLHFADPPRKIWSTLQRNKELARWYKDISNDKIRSRLVEEINEIAIKTLIKDGINHLNQIDFQNNHILNKDTYIKKCEQALVDQTQQLQLVNIELEKMTNSLTWQIRERNLKLLNRFPNALLTMKKVLRALIKK